MSSASTSSFRYSRRLWICGEPLLVLADLPLQLRDPAVAELGGLLQVAPPGGLLHLAPERLDLGLPALDLLDRAFSACHCAFIAAALLLELGESPARRLAPLAAGLVLLLEQRLALDLELDDPALDLVDLLRQGVDLDPEPAGRLVHQVDRLVGQEAVADVAIGQRGGGDQGVVGDPDAVMDLVLLLEPAENRDGVLDARRAHQHRLEAALERGVLLDVLAVLVERGGADHVELAAGQRGLEHVAGVHRAFGRAGADDGVQLVDEDDVAALGLGQLLDDRLEPLLEFAPVLGAGQQQADVERDDLPVAQRLGHVAVDDPLGQPLDDGGLAHAGLADQHRVVLGPAREHLHHPADFLVAADDRIELSLRGPGRSGCG